MINRNNKKGFTIVELVIVIAVIAILAAVLIPTFSGIIAKANESADIKAVREMNTALAAEFAAEKPAAKDIKKVIDALEKNGFNSADSLSPVSKGLKFMWYHDDKIDSIILVDENNVVVFPEDITYDETKVMDLGENVNKYVDVTVNNSTSIIDAITKGHSDIKLENDLEYSGEQLTIPTGNTLTLDLNGKNFDASSQASRPFRMTSNSALVINAEGSTIESGAYGLVEIPAGAQNVSVTINGGTVTGTMDDGAFIKVRNGNGNINITLNGVSMIDGTNAAPSDSWLLSTESSFSGNINLNITGGVFEAKVGFQCFKGTYTISGAKITTDAFAFEVAAKSTATFENCTITTGSASAGFPAMGVAASGLGTANIKSGSYTSTASGYCAGVLTTGGTLNISGGTFKGSLFIGNDHNSTSVDSVINITGGTFDGKAFNSLTKDEWLAKLGDSYGSDTVEITGAGTNNVTIKVAK